MTRPCSQTLAESVRYARRVEVPVYWGPRQFVQTALECLPSDIPGRHRLVS